MAPSRAARGLQHAILLAATLVALAPSAFMLLTSLKSQAEYVFNKTGLPQAPVLEHRGRRAAIDPESRPWACRRSGRSRSLLTGRCARTRTQAVCRPSAGR